MCRLGATQLRLELLENMAQRQNPRLDKEKGCAKEGLRPDGFGAVSLQVWWCLSAARIVVAAEPLFFHRSVSPATGVSLQGYIRVNIGGSPMPLKSHVATRNSVAR